MSGRRIITLLTDFGDRDPYVASMKGVILAIHPECRIVDISHHVRPQDVREAAFLLANSFSYFPEGTIHVSVVDPGVGSARKPLLFVTPRYCFVGPDNGLFTVALRRDKIEEAVVLTSRKYFLPRLSSTFHGRDIFAPVAAHLSRGVKPRAFGQRIDTWVSLDIPEPEQRGNELRGEISHIDAFGNLISNLTEERVSDFSRGRPLSIHVKGKVFQGLSKGYWEGQRGRLMALFGSGGFVEVSVREGSAARALRAKRGDMIRLRVAGGLHA